MEIPPGILYLSQISPAIILPSVATYCFLNLGGRWFDFQAPIWFLVLATFTAKPILWLISTNYRDWKTKWDARAQGASLIPVVKIRWPQSWFTTKALVDNFRYGYPGDRFFEWKETYGNTFCLNLLLENRIFTFEPDHIKAILATQFDNFEKGPVSFSQFHSLLGTGVFNSDGEMWKFHRTMTRPFFSKERISHFDVFDRHADDAISQAKARLADGYPIDFQDLVARFTLDSATEFLFGNDVQSLSAGLPYPYTSSLSNSTAFVNHPSNVFVTAFLAGQDQVSLRARYGPSWPLMEFWKDKIKSHRAVIDGFIDPILNKALEKKKSNETETSRSGDTYTAQPEAETLLDHLVNHTEDNQILKDELTNLLVAARDTTASTLTFALYMLSENPEIAQRLRKEVLEKVGSQRRPNYDDMREMKYLRAFINETLRLYPPVPFDGRTSKKSTVWTSKALGSKPLYVPAQTKCSYGVFLMHRRADLWGPDALQFDPDRFLDERLHKYLTPNPYIFVPFNAGPRICLGQQFAYHESSFFLVRLLQSFSAFSLATDAQPPATRPPATWSSCVGTKGTDKVWPGTHLTMYVKGGLWVRMEEATVGTGPVDTVL